MALFAILSFYRNETVYLLGEAKVQTCKSINKTFERRGFVRDVRF